ncbi:O-antigen/teichoic acid export membrane protein [Oikeobacillus pervagus]|uniref:O-antigen/teichoic acid export membrane protein n=1 Tax=Oikeobacillus pervagus TaxID=1325931 RepID=A0AAJ1T1A1_9BACI|nr:polysaccharide biosynthesis protein [Oikeobacillus pervagus]MDQ0216743.1 O-antigen/teichoic acid export membrane protein [Oikeobacillus pervagus]
MKSFIKGTLLLCVAAFFGECLEFLTNMILANELGEHGMGKYMSILPSVFLVVILASFELPISISKFIAEKETTFHRSMLHHAMRLAIFITCALLLITTFIFSFFPVFHDFHPMTRWLVLILIPVVSFSSVARGYFMGIQQMKRIAVANFLRKLFQLALLVLVYRLFDFNQEMAILVALGTVIASEIIVFLYLMYSYYLQTKILKRVPKKWLTGKEARKSLLSVSLPTTGMRIFNAVTNAIQPFFITYVLGLSGLTKVVATEQYGMVAGVAFSIGFFPAFIAHSLLVMLIPTVSEGYAKKDMEKLRRLLKQVIGITISYGVPAMVIVYFWADFFTQWFVPSLEAAYFLQLLLPYFLFHYISIPLQAILIGIGLVKDTFYHTVIATIVEFGFIYILGSHGSLQMKGVILGMNFGAVLLALLHYFTICKKLGVSLLLNKFNERVLY